MFAIGGEHDDAEAGNIDGVSGMNDAARRCADGLDVSRVVVARDVGVFAIDAVVEEFADLDALTKIRHATDVIHMEVGDEHLVDLGDAGIFHCRLNAVGVATIVAGPASIDETEKTAEGERAEWTGHLRRRWCRCADGFTWPARALRGARAMTKKRERTQKEKQNGDGAGYLGLSLRPKELRRW